MGYIFKYTLGESIQFGDLEGFVTGIDSSLRFGIEAEFLASDGKKVICYFDNNGKFKAQDSPDVLVKRRSKS